MNDKSSLDISIIIVSYNTRDILRDCLTSVMAAVAGLPTEVIVIENASRDGSADMVADEFPAVRLYRSTVNLGFAAANNVGFRMMADNRYVVLLNPDAVIEADALRNAVTRMDRQNRVGMAGGLLIDRDGRHQPSARKFPSLLNEVLVISGLADKYPKSRLFGRFDRTWADPLQSASVDWVPGAFSIIRRPALDAIGGFDERFFLYYEEVDLCRRFKAAGWEIGYWPDIVVRHLGGESSKTVENVEFSQSGSQLVLWRMRSALLYYRKHHGYTGAWLLAKLESTWQDLRRLKAAWPNVSGAGNAKSAEAGRMATLMRRAWHETAGGTVSPPRPW